MIIVTENYESLCSAPLTQPLTLPQSELKEFPAAAAVFDELAVNDPAYKSEADKASTDPNRF